MSVTLTSADQSSKHWSSADRKKLLSAYRVGGIKEVYRVFPDRTPNALRSAVSRFRDTRPMGALKVPADRDMIRARMTAIHPEMLRDRLAEFLQKYRTDRSASQ